MFACQCVHGFTSGNLNSAQNGRAFSLTELASVSKTNNSRSLLAPPDLMKPPASSTAKKLPRGNSSLPKRVVQHDQKVRLIHAMAQAVADKGYAATTLADITAHAGVSRTSFYELFKDKEDCYLCGLRSTSKAHLTAVKTAMGMAEHPADQGALLFQTLIEFVDQDHTLARAFIAESVGSTPTIRNTHEGLIANFTKLVSEWLSSTQALHPEVHPTSEQTLQMVTAAIWSLMETRSRQSTRIRPESMVDATVFIFAALGLYGWAQDARRGGAPWGKPLG